MDITATIAAELGVRKNQVDAAVVDDMLGRKKKKNSGEELREMMARLSAEKNNKKG